MMKSSLPPLAHILRTGFQKGQQRLHLLLLLSALYGLLASIAVEPSQAVISGFFDALAGETQDGPNASAILMDGSLAILFGQALSLFLSALLLAPWSRAMANGPLIPNEGGLSQLFRRSLRCFMHLLTATILSMLAVVIIAIILYAVTSVVGAIATVISFAGIIFVIWFIVVTNAVAHLAMYYEAQDEHVSFAETWLSVKPNVLPIAATYACYSVIALFINMLIGNVLGETAMQNIPHITLALGSALGFAASAFFIAALSKIHFK